MGGGVNRPLDKIPPPQERAQLIGDPKTDLGSSVVSMEGLNRSGVDRNYAPAMPAFTQPPSPSQFIAHSMCSSPWLCSSSNNSASYPPSLG